MAVAHIKSLRGITNTPPNDGKYLMIIIIVINVIIICDIRHIQALLPDGQRVEAPDPGGT